jgi:hypothetical protein
MRRLRCGLPRFAVLVLALCAGAVLLGFGGQVLLQRDVHTLHVYDAVLDAEDAHEVRMLRDEQEGVPLFHGKGVVRIPRSPHYDTVTYEEHNRLAALHTTMYGGCTVYKKNTRAFQLYFYFF